MKYTVLLIRYGELSLKSPYVRKQFESRLISNIIQILKKEKIPVKVQQERGRIYLYLDEIHRAADSISRVFGIVSVSPAVETTASLQDLSTTAIECAKKHIHSHDRFALRVTRTGTHEYTSQQVACAIGNDIVQTTDAGVDLTNPTVELFIEIRNNKGFLFFEKKPGPGGLPLGTQGKILMVLTKPVSHSLLAAWYLMRRGCTPVFVANDENDNIQIHRFLSFWHSDSEITTLSFDHPTFFHSLQDILSVSQADAVVTGHLFETKKDIETITVWKQQCNLAILTPLVGQERSTIQQKMKEVGITI